MKKLLLLTVLFLFPFFLFSQKISMNFDSLSDFSKQFGSWRAVDVDQELTYGFTHWGFPGNTYPMAFIVFNPDSTTPPMDTVPGIQPHSVPRFGACFSTTTGSNNDWFISPAVTLKYDGSFSFWVKSYTLEFGPEKYRVAVSVTDSNPSSFSIISGDTLLAPGTWIKKTFSLSQWNNQKVYVAIQCVSHDAFVFMIDDLEVDPGSDTLLPPSHIFEDFESMSDFSKDLSPWTVNDVKGGLTYGIDGHTFPHSGEPMAYIVFNPSKTVPPMIDQGSQAHSGSRYAASFATMPPRNPNNKWLISPRMKLGSTPKIGLWTETYNAEFGMEKYRILVSTKSDDPSDFVVVSGLAPLEAPMYWGYSQTDLSAFADSLAYVAIQCVSDNTFFLMVDDIEIGSNVGVEDQEPAIRISVYPNPVSDHFRIVADKSIEINSAELIDFSGKKITSVNAEGIRQKINLPSLSDGMYFLLLRTNRGEFAVKMIIKK